jgi:hypothetical protein
VRNSVHILSQEVIDRQPIAWPESEAGAIFWNSIYPGYKCPSFQCASFVDGGSDGDWGGEYGQEKGRSQEHACGWCEHFHLESVKEGCELSEDKGQSRSASWLKMKMVEDKKAGKEASRSTTREDETAG